MSDIETTENIVGGLEGNVSFNDALTAYGDDLVATNTNELVDKADLVGVPFLVKNWRVNEGERGLFVSVEIVTEDDRNLVFNDGSTGVYRQLEGNPDTGEAGLATRLGRRGGIMCRQGLRKSEYDAVDAKGKPVHATTYYLN
jgi:hypothetical protein